MRSVQISVAVLLLAACSSGSSPCPPGYVVERQQDNCVLRERDADASLDAGMAEAASTEADGALEDGALTRDADLLDGEPLDGSPRDAATARDAIADVERTPCVEQDLESWLPNYGLSVAEGSDCFSECGDNQVCAASCVAEATRMNSCQACTNQQAECVVKFCAEACSAPNSDTTCMACQCEAHCQVYVIACTSFGVPTCPLSLFGPTPKPTDAPVTVPLLLREQSATGAYRAARMTPEAGPWSESARHQYSRYFNHLLAFPLAGREYVLHIKSSCEGGPCLIQLSALMEDGTLSHDVWGNVTDGGYSENDVFASNGVMYLTRSRSPWPNDPFPGKVLLWRIAMNGDNVEVTALPDLSLLTGDNKSYDVIEPFQIGTTTYLMGYQRGTGETRFYRFDNGTVTAVSNPFTLPSGTNVHVLEPFKIGSRWLLLTHKNSGATGTATLYDFVLNGSQVSLSAQLHQVTTWPAYTDAVGVSVSATQSQLVLHNANTGGTTLYTISADPSIAISGGSYINSLNANQRWDVFEVAKQGKW